MFVGVFLPNIIKPIPEFQNDSKISKEIEIKNFQNHEILGAFQK